MVHAIGRTEPMDSDTRFFCLSFFCFLSLSLSLFRLSARTGFWTRQPVNLARYARIVKVDRRCGVSVQWLPAYFCLPFSALFLSFSLFDIFILLVLLRSSCNLREKKELEAVKAAKTAAPHARAAPESD
jgi:hypothetical protein